MINTTLLNVRATASTGSYIMGMFEEGDTINVLDTDLVYDENKEFSFYKVLYKDKVGYVVSEYLEIEEMR